MWISNNQRNWFSSSRLECRNQFREILVYSNKNGNFSGIWRKQNFYESGKLFHSVNSLIVYSITDHTCSVDFRLRGKSHEKQLILPAWWNSLFTLVMAFAHSPIYCLRERTIIMICEQNQQKHENWLERKSAWNWNFDGFSNQIHLIFGL